jgi:flagella basal body P-ring formation protein FlgA
MFPGRHNHRWLPKHASMLASMPLLAAAIAPMAPVDAAALADHAQLRSLAEAHATRLARAAAPQGARLESEAARLDPRLRLAACGTTPTTFDPPGQRAGANVSVGVRCTQGAEWTLYIPVRVIMRGEVVVLAAPAARGEVLTLAHMRTESQDLAQLNAGYFSDPEEILGMVLRRPLRPGQVVTANALERPRLVARGQRVRVIAIGGSFAVQTEGEALADAAEGDRVRVRNLHSRSIVEGQVDELGRVVTRR